MSRVRLLVIAVALLVVGSPWVTGQDAGRSKDSREPAPKMRGQLPPNWGKLGLSDEQKQKVYEAQNKHRAKIEALQKQIAEKLQSYLANPEVTVIVQEVRSKKFNVIGEVQRPGAYSLSNATTVLDALALAGGFKDFAKQSKIYVLRIQPDGSRSRLPFNYKKVVKGRDLRENVPLQNGDTIVVP